MKLVVKYNLLKYADNEEKSQTNKYRKFIKKLKLTFLNLNISFKFGTKPECKAFAAQ